MSDYLAKCWGSSKDTASPHALSLQDTLGAGKPIETSMKGFDCPNKKVYRPTIGFYGNVYFTDDFGNTIRLDPSSASKVHTFIQ